MGEAVVELFSNTSKWDKLAYQIGGAGLKPPNQFFFAEASYVRCYWSKRQYREFVAKRLLAEGQKVRAVGRTDDRLQPLANLGAEPFVADLAEAPECP